MSIPVSSLQDIALIAGPALAAIAATASWAAVFHAVRLTRRSNQPYLRIQCIVSPDTGCYGAVIINVGDGVASGVGYAIADRQTVIAGHIGHGFLRPGESVELLSTCMPVLEGDRHAVVGIGICRDRHGVPHDWTSGEDHGTNEARSWKSGFRKRPIYSDIIPRLAKWFPDWTEPTSLTQIHVATQRKV